MSGPEWMQRLRDVGPLLGAAERFLRDESGSGSLLPGPDGIAWLVRCIDRFARRDVSPREEAAFIEGAGAVLGLLLIEHVGDAAHATRDGVHRLRLGAYGFFDPFAAIQRALEGDAATRSTLIEELARAEAEASGAGPIARGGAAFDRILAMRRPDLSIADRFEHRVWLSDGVEVDLERIIATSDGQHPEALDRSVEKLVAMLPGGARAENAITREEAMGRLLPRLLGPSTRASTPAGLFVSMLPHDVSIALVLAYEGRSRFVRTAELERWEMTPGQAIEHAVARLAERSSRARFARLQTDTGPLVVARTGDGLDSARLVLPGLHDVLAAELGTPFLVAVPHRDTLLAAPSSDPAARENLAARAAIDAARAPHRITDALFEISPHGLRAA